MRSTILKLSNTNIYPLLTYVFYNKYFIKTVYFGYRIISINTQQEIELRKIFEEIILKKLDLRSTFPRWVLYTRKSAIRIIIMKPSIIINMLALKVYIGYYQQ